jgi:hypothetical protein
LLWLAVLAAALLAAVAPVMSAPMDMPIGPVVPALRAIGPIQIGQLKLPQRLQLIGKSQAIRGFYSNKSVPLIIDDINRMNVREALPIGSYMLLAGPTPTNLRHGDSVELRGVIARPTAVDPVHLQGEQTILRLGGAADAIRVVTQSALRPVVVVSAAITQQLAVASSKWRIRIKPGVLLVPTHYAVLINGGINSANYWTSFYNDLVIDYNMLIGRGYSAANITVLNADGGGPPLSPPAPAACGTIPVNGAATAANVTNVFHDLAAKMKAQDTLVVMITDHGGTGVICLWHENMSGTTFGNLVNGIANYSQMTFSFDLCHAAGLIPRVLGANRLVFAACDADKSAYDTTHGHYGALNYAVISALTGMAPVGGAVNADANTDGKISLAETFNYVRAHIDSGGSQTPHYEDNNASPDTTAALIAGTEGVLGSGAFL